MGLFAKKDHDGPCPDNGQSQGGQCLGKCFECDAHLLCTGSYTVYCPDCQCCSECECPQVDGFSHYVECQLTMTEEEEEEEEEEERV